MLPCRLRAAFCSSAPRGVAIHNLPMLDEVRIRKELAALRIEHRDLDQIIERVHESAPFDLLQLQRLKKRKLVLRDRISRLESQLLPDIIA